jgi:hypothetical protein
MMIEIHDEDLIRRLRALADARGESVDSVLKMLLDVQDMHQPATRQSGSKRLLEVARRVNLHSDSMTDTSDLDFAQIKCGIGLSL